MKKKRKVSHNELPAAPEKDAVPPASDVRPTVGQLRAERETDSAPPAPDIPDLPAIPPARAASLTPRELAAVLNEPRRTPAAGLPAVTAVAPAPADPRSPLAIAAAQPPAPPHAPPPAEAEVLLFRLGGERFAASLAAIDEAVDLPELHTIPESPPDLLGVFELRGRLLPLYSAASALRVPEPDHAPRCAFVLSYEGTRLGIAVDVLDDAITLPADALRAAPDGGEEGDGVLLGVAHAPDGVVTVVSASALARSCLGSALETGDEQETSAAPEAA